MHLLYISWVLCASLRPSYHFCVVFCFVFSRSLHDTSFLFVTDVMVSKNYGFKWFAVVVLTLSRLQMDGSGKTLLAAVRFTVLG